MNCSAVNATGNFEGTRGWVRQSNDRGSLDIIMLHYDLSLHLDLRLRQRPST